MGIPYTTPSEFNQNVLSEEENKPVVLVVTDNEQKLQYINSLLQKSYSIIASSNGMEALTIAKKETPVLILSNCSLPDMQGVELLRSIKETISTSTVPFVLVCDQEIEHDKLEAIESGCGDYIVLPVSVKEFRLRIRAQINLANNINDTLLKVYNVFDAAPFAVAVLKGETLIIEFINQYNLEIWQKKKEEVVGKPLFETRPDIRAGAEPIHQEVYRTGKRFTANEVPIELTLNSERKTHYFNVVIDPLFNEHNKVIGQLATSIDITEQVLARKKIEESEKSIKAVKEQLELTIENVPAAVYLFDNTGKIQYANKPGYENLKSILGEEYDPSEDLTMMMKRTLGKVEYKDQNGNFISEDKYPTYIALKTGKEAELLIKRINLITGKSSWFLSKSNALVGEDGKVQFVLSTSTDLTDQQEAEEKIRESENRFRMLADALPQMVWMRNLQGKIEYGSKHWEEYSGVEGVSAAWKAMVHPDDWNNIMQTWERHFAQGKPFQHEVRLKNKNNEYKWHNAIGEPLKDNEGNITKWIGVLTDIHIQKTFAENLENLVAKRTEELERSNEDLQQFAHVASHDLKEPVRKIMTFTNRIIDESQNKLSSKINSYLSKILSSTIRMYSMIDGVLLYSSISSAEQTKELVDLNDLLNSVVSELEIPILEKNAIIYLDDLPTVPGFPILLYQMFYNLLNNSIKFSKPGVPPIITCKAEKADNSELTQIKINIKPRYTKLIIEDNGIGFNNEYAQKIFGTFTRLHPKDEYEGTGLGLSLCRKIAERHEGIIYAESIESSGSKFVVILPS